MPKSRANLREDEAFYRADSVRMKDLPPTLRPREIFALRGAEHVSEPVLLALLLRTGVPGENALQLAERLLLEYGSLTALAGSTTDDLTRRKGLGPVKAQMLKAALELARRLAAEALPQALAVRSPETVAAVIRESARVLDHECFWVLPLDAKNRLKRPPIEISSGILDVSLVHPREVFRPAIQCSCGAIVLAHNHPSGDPTPSAEDIRITRKLVEAGRLLEIRVFDHVIVGRRRAGEERDFVSLRESGCLSFEKGA